VSRKGATGEKNLMKSVNGLGSKKISGDNAFCHQKEA